MNKLIIIGAGSHGKVVAEAALLSGKWELVGFADDQLKIGTKILKDLKIVCSTNDMLGSKEHAAYFLIAIGNNVTREKLFLDYSSQLKAAIVIHPSAVVSTFACLGEGTVVLANAVINANASVGKNNIINSLALVDHDTEIGDHVHIAQGTIVGGSCKIPSHFLSKLGEHIPSNTKLS